MIALLRVAWGFVGIHFLHPILINVQPLLLPTPRGSGRAELLGYGGSGPV